MPQKLVEFVSFAQAHRLFKGAETKIPRAFLYKAARHIESTVTIALIVRTTISRKIPGKSARTSFRLRRSLPSSISVHAGRRSKLFTSKIATFRGFKRRNEMVDTKNSDAQVGQGALASA